MRNSKSGRSFIRCGRSQYVFPFIPSCALAPATAPLFRLKYAKIIVAEQGGTYDEKLDMFVIEEGGISRAYTSITKVVKGNATKLYQIGPDWDWTVLEKEKVFEASWDDNFYNPGKYLVSEDFFCEGRAYDEDELAALREMPVGGYWTSNDYGSAHTATRVV